MVTLLVGEKIRGIQEEIPRHILWKEDQIIFRFTLNYLCVLAFIYKTLEQESRQLVVARILSWPVIVI